MIGYFICYFFLNKSVVFQAIYGIYIVLLRITLVYTVDSA